MIAVDTSALIAILREEEEAASFAATLADNEPVHIAAPTLFEYLMVAEGRSAELRGDRAGGRAQALLSSFEHEVVSFTQAHAAIAHAAFRRFGKGSGHKAQLNFGDCMSYALARALEVPLLYKGRDLAMTDVRAAL